MRGTRASAPKGRDIPAQGSALGTARRPLGATRAASPLAHLLGALCLLAALVWGAPVAAQDIREEVKKAPEPKLTKAPKLIKFVAAKYPAEQQEAGIEGTVDLSLVIDASGKVTKVTVEGSPHPALSAAATVAVLQFQFSPAEVDGTAAPVRIGYAYNFVLDIQFNPRLPRWMEQQETAEAGADVLVGKVREQGSRVPLPGIAVVIRDLGLEVTTDSQGRFAFKAVPPGNYKVEALSTEHKKEIVSAEVTAGKQTRVTFYIKPRRVNPYETVVRGKRRQTSVSRVSLRQKELTTVPGTFGDPVRVVENLPGVARVPYVGGALLIRGSAPNDSGVFLDGTKIPLLYHFMGGPSVLNPEFLDRIDYYPGNADVRYGRLLAGVVDVSTRNTFTEELGGSVDINLLNTAAMIKVPLTSKVSVAGAFRRSYIDALLPPILDAAGEDTTVVLPVYYDYQLRVDVKLGGEDQLYFLVFGSDDALDLVTTNPDRSIDVSIDYSVIFHRILAGWRWQISDRLVSRMTPTFGINIVDMDFAGNRIDLKTLAFLLREELEYKHNKAFTFRFGADLNIRRNWFLAVVPIPVDYRNPGSGKDVQIEDESSELEYNQWQYGLGFYADAIINVTDKLQLIPGARFDIMRYFGNTRMSVDPRITARYQMLPKTTIKAAAGLYSNHPEPREVNDQYGNPNLVLEHAAHFSLGVEQKIFKALSLDVQGYFIWRYDSVVPTKQVKVTGDGVRRLQFLNEGSGYSTGMELILKHDVTRHFYGWLAYTLSMSKAQEKPDGDHVFFAFDQTHILTLVASYRIGWGWELGARFRLVSGRPDTPVLGGIYDSDINKYTRLTGEKFSNRLPVFHQLDFRAEKTWIFELWRLSVYLDIQNVYNATNAEATLWDYRFRESGPLQGLPFLPTLGIKGSF